MNKPTTAICITTFLRDNLLYKCIQSIVDNHNDNYHILIADQGYNSPEKLITINYYQSQIPLEYYRLPFDCGLSIAKNFLVQRASEMQVPYCLIMPDSIQFIEIYNFESLSNKLDNNVIINFNLKNVEPITLKTILLASTKCLIDLWDNELKLWEHELVHSRCIKKDYKIEWNENYNFKKIKSKGSEEYQIYCKRIKEYQKLSKQKIGELCM